MAIVSFPNLEVCADDFLSLPTRLYADDPKYIPPVKKDIRQWLNHSPASGATAHFLAYQGGVAVGRVSAFANDQLRDTDDTRLGTIGLFECVDDYSVARELFDAAISWLRDSHGLTCVWGPMNGDIWHGYRLMTRGFDQEPFVGEPYNKPYYPHLFEQFGFKVKQEWDSVEIEGADLLHKMIERGRQRLDLLKAKGYRLETWNPKRRTELIHTLYLVLCESYGRFLGYTPISQTEFEWIFEQLEPALDPELFLLCWSPDGACTGFAVAFPDLAEPVRAMRGNSDLFARLRFLAHHRRAHRLNFYIGGVTPREEAKGSGLGRAGFYYIINRGLEKGYTNLLLTLRLKGNKAHGLAARSGVVPQREYALYEYLYER
ncbi:MAG: hypothetical protein HY851_02575 [candidate division Zixibacteria bacterium]|nr:hypothetical protein [candidate division Zixibacteria bacterium]